MRIAAAAISICVILLLLVLGCSEEEQPIYSGQPVKVKKPIRKPVPEKAKIALPVKVVKPELESEKTPIVESPAVEEKTIESQERIAKKTETSTKEEEGYYITKDGDNLSGIAKRKDIYGDPLRWPVLYRLNINNLASIKNDGDLPHKELPKGIRLKFITADEVKENLKRMPRKIWVLNVLSSTKERKIVLKALRLIDGGYPVYITRSKIKGKEWMRLRVGFFREKRDADREGKKIKGMLNISDIWTTRIGEKELAEFGGYYFFGTEIYER